MKKLILSLFLFSLNATASEICPLEQGVFVGSEIHACGEGTHSNLNLAQRRADQEAEAQFHQVCRNWDCLKHEIRVASQKASCQKTDQNYHCSKKITYRIGGISRNDAVASVWR